VSQSQPRVRTLPGARWSCRSCGHCCRSFDLGPIEQETFEALQAADPGSFWAPARQRPWSELREGPDGQRLAWLTRVDGACIFLDAEMRCAIHAELGEAAKPAFCREFPFHLVRERDGHSAVIRPTCAGLHQARVDGEAIAARAQDLPDLPRAYPVAHFAPERVEILPGLGVDLDGWYDAEPAILRLLDAPDEDPRQSVVQLRDALARATGRSLPAPDDERYRDATAVVLALLTTTLRSMKPPPSSDPRAALPGRAASWLETAMSSKPAPLTPDAQAYLNEILRSQIVGKLFHRMGGMPRALGLFLVEVHMARAALADEQGSALDAAQLSSVLAPWWNMAGHRDVVRVLELAAPTFEDIFIYA